MTNKTQLQESIDSLRRLIEQDEVMVGNTDDKQLSIRYAKVCIMLHLVDEAINEYEKQVEDMLDNVTVLVDSIADKS